MTGHESRMTRDHDEIRRWVEERGGRPASIKGTEQDEPAGLLRIDFPEQGAEEGLEHVTWDEFFAKFDEKELTFLYQEETADGGVSRFNKFVYEGDRGEERADQASLKGREGRGAAEAEGMKKPRDRGEKGR